MHPIKAGIDIGGVFALAAAWSGLLSTTLTIATTLAGLIWYSIQIYEWLRKPKRT